MEEQHLVTVRRGRTRIDIEWLGEGVSGDFDPDDPSDQPQARFSAYVDGEPLANGSYCTCMPATAETADLTSLGMHVLDVIQDDADGESARQENDPVMDGHSIRRVAESLSTLSLRDREEFPDPDSPYRAARDLRRSAEAVLESLSREGCEDDLAVVNREAVAALAEARERCVRLGCGDADLLNGAETMVDSADASGCEAPWTVVQAGDIAAPLEALEAKDRPSAAMAPS